MAATPSKPSPSNTPVAGNATTTTNSSSSNNSNTDPINDPPKTNDATDAAATAAASTEMSELAPTLLLKDPPPTAASDHHHNNNIEEPISYASSEQSPALIAARALLAAGRLEEALEQIEQGLEATRRCLMPSRKVGSDDDTNNNDTFDDDTDVLSFHPALAPFHYLYGTTLLYVVEESADDQMVTPRAAAAASADDNDDDAAAAHGPPQDMDPEAASGDAAEAASGDAEAVIEQEEPDADDLQIAWEHLDLARTILERALSHCHGNGGSAKYDLDLANIYNRCADVHRMNGCYQQATQDYATCLQLRSQHLPAFDRKLADVQYHLGMAHMLLVAEQQTTTLSLTTTTKDDNDTGATAEDDATTTRTTPPMRPDNLAQHRARSIHYYYASGRTLAGHLAMLCGCDDPEAFVARAEAAAAGKDHKNHHHNNSDDDPVVAARKLASLLQHVEQELSVPKNDTNDDYPHRVAQFHELSQLLQEIQETVDQAQTSEEGVHQVSELKAHITAAVAAETSRNSGGDGTIETSIGFATTTAAAAAMPLAAVKKKKKRPEEEEDAKRPADPSKRPRNE